MWKKSGNYFIVQIYLVDILPSAGSLPTPKQCCRPGWNQECRSSIWVSHMNGKELSTWAIMKYLAWNISRNLEQIWNNQDSNHTVRWDIDVPRSGLTNCATVVTLERAGNKWSSLKSLCVYKNLQTQDYKTTWIYIPSNSILTLGTTEFLLAEHHHMWLKRWKMVP